MNIDTTDNEYNKLYDGIATLRTHMAPKLALFARLPRAKQKQWLRKDRLLRRTIKLAVDLSKWAEQFSMDVQDDS